MHSTLFAASLNPHIETLPLVIRILMTVAAIGAGIALVVSDLKRPILFIFGSPVGTFCAALLFLVAAGLIFGML